VGPRAAIAMVWRPVVLYFVLKRSLFSVLTIFGVVTVTFFLMRLAGDPAALLLPVEATPDEIARLRTALGLDEPLQVQFVKFLTNGLRGDFGDSLRQKVPALGLVLERLPATLELALAAFVVGITLAFLCGLAIRLVGSSALRAVLMWLALMRQAMPVFSFGILAILVFSVWLQWLPSLGRGSLQHLILPALTMGTYELALYLRLFNLSLAAEQRQDYVRTAYAKGQGRAAVILRHMLPNALLPLVTVAGINLGLMLGGAVVTETVFSWPGVGRLIIDAVNQRDFPVVIAGVFVVSLLFVVINLLVDILYGVLDPRVKLG
jgi:peptide/nickel transport system permease protein